MIPAPRLADIQLMLNERDPRSSSGYLRAIDDDVRIMAILLLAPDMADKQTANLLASIETLHRDAGLKFHFLLAGVSRYGGHRRVGTLDRGDLFFNDSLFAEFIEGLEEQVTGWEYGYKLELILLDICGERPHRKLDYRNTIRFKIEDIVQAGIADSAAQFLGRVIRLHREAHVGGVAKIRDHFHDLFGVNWLMAVILSMFPKALGRLARVEAVLRGESAQIGLGSD